MRARLQSILIVRFHLLTFAIFLAFVDDRFMDRLKIMTFKRMAADVNVKVSCFRAVCTKTSPSSLHISFPRPVVHFLQRSPDEAGCEDRWGILSQSQVPDLTGVSVLSEFLVSHIMTQASASSRVLICCLDVFGLRYTVLRCRLISPRNM